jgi:hypothetical protein
MVLYTSQSTVRWSVSPHNRQGILAVVEVAADNDADDNADGVDDDADDADDDTETMERAALLFERDGQYLVRCPDFPHVKHLFVAPKIILLISSKSVCSNTAREKRPPRTLSTPYCNICFTTSFSSSRGLVERYLLTISIGGFCFVQ